MVKDLSLLEIGRVIFHNVPSRRAGSTTGPTLSEIESQLDAVPLNYFRRKLVATLSNNAYPVIFDSSISSVVPSLVLNNLVGV